MPLGPILLTSPLLAFPLLEKYLVLKEGICSPAGRRCSQDCSGQLEIPDKALFLYTFSDHLKQLKSIGNILDLRGFVLTGPCCSLQF